MESKCICIKIENSHFIVEEGKIIDLLSDFGTLKELVLLQHETENMYIAFAKMSDDSDPQLVVSALDGKFLYDCSGLMHITVASRDALHLSDPSEKCSIAPMDMLNPNAPRSQTTSAVVLVSNLNPLSTTHAHLVALFGCYGSVSRTLFLSSKPGHALIEYEQGPANAAIAIRCLNMVRLHGRCLWVTMSNHETILTSCAADPGLRDHSLSPLRRKPASLARAAHPPGATLIVANLPLCASPASVRTLFERCGGDVSEGGAGWQVRDVKIVHTSDRSCVARVTMGRMSHAVDALVRLHGKRLFDHSLDVRFRKPKG